MGYYSEVALAMPEFEWNGLAIQGAEIEYSVFESYNSKSCFDRADVDFYEDDEDNQAKWVLVRWTSIQWNPFLNATIHLIEDYLDNQEGPYEFPRLGEDLFVEQRCCGISEQVLGINASIEAYI